ncbi:hypothetical protein GOBAR_DD05459 [Gossypium barbadense]|nr:hypothetical protein GOBAR_DD05459 [Gossypium barbadense]
MVLPSGNQLTMKSQYHEMYCVMVVHLIPCQGISQQLTVAQSSDPGAAGSLSGSGDALNVRVSTPIDQPGFLAVPSPGTGTTASLSSSI